MSFFLPVIRPPKAMIANPLSYYADLEAQLVRINVMSLTPGGPMEIQVENADVLHAEEPKVPVKTAFAMTSGFVHYEEPGKVTLRVWVADFFGLAKSTPEAARANRIVVSSMDGPSVEPAMRERIATMTTAQLEESWRQHHSTVVPGRQGLEDDLWARFVAQTADIFVTGGTPLGVGSPVTSTATSAPVAHVFLEASFEAPGAAAVAVAPEDLLDSAGTALRVLKYTGHPLLNKISEPIVIDFKSRFFIWDNTPAVRDYQPLVGTVVELFQGPSIGLLADTGVADVSLFTATTGPDGRITPVLGVSVPARALIYFRYTTDATTVGTRTFHENIRTDAHKARVHLDWTGPTATNSRDYRAKYEIAPKYQDFTDELADHESDEKYLLDRGSMMLIERSLPTSHFNFWEDVEWAVSKPLLVVAFNERHYLKHIRRCEATYKADTLPAAGTTFNVLFEGDSWLNYPFAFNDVYGHLDEIIWSQLKSGVTYNRIPLQHFGDRSDHMFVASPSSGTRQWDFSLDFLDEYKIDLIVVSAGGNDIAEPGIANDAGSPFDTYFTAGPAGLASHFNPFAADASLVSSGGLDAAHMALAVTLMKRSFAGLLKNHRWFSYLNGTAQLDTATMSAVLQPLLNNVLSQNSLPQSAFGTDDPLLQFDHLQDIGTNVIANFPDSIAPLSAEEALLQAVFDQAAIDQRYGTIKANWEIVLQEATGRGIPVITHSYGYPLFNEEATSVFGLAKDRRAGPWFTNRFEEALIADRRIRKMCLKLILDKFFTDILIPLKTVYPSFDYVDTRRANTSTGDWRDEMHLHNAGFRRVAEALFDKVAGRFPDFLTSRPI